MEPIVRIPLPDPVAAADSAGRAGVGLDGGLLPWFVGPENRLVEVVVHAVLADATVQYNPLVLAGESGLGKSHLVLGLAAAYRAQYPRRPVVCLPAVDFSREWADAIESQSAVDFRRGYRAARLVVIEDVLRLADHEGAQQALVHVLDDATAAGHQVLVTAPSPPGHWPRIHAALQTRLEAGLCVRLASPSMETRLAILRDAAARRGPRLDEPAARALAAGLEGSVRELLGSLAELHADQRIHDRPLDVAAARAYVSRRRAGSAVELRDIASAAARAFSLPLAQLRGRSQRQDAVSARGVAMYLARQLTELSLEQIGRYFGGRDHTTVLHQCRKTKQLRETEPAVEKMIERVEDILRAAKPLVPRELVAGAV